MRLSLCLPLAAALATGCGGSRLAPVSGKITLDNKPLPKARITFQPTDGLNPGVGSSGVADDNGEYTLQPVDGKGSGALVGKHRVEISLLKGGTNPEDDRQRTVNLVPPQYNLKSTLTFEVKPGSNTADWPLTTK
jgi:hypothetical protein